MAITRKYELPGPNDVLLPAEQLLLYRKAHRNPDGEVKPPTELRDDGPTPEDGETTRPAASFNFTAKDAKPAEAPSFGAHFTLRANAGEQLPGNAAEQGNGPEE
jgi:hypothetical protein